MKSESAVKKAVDLVLDAMTDSHFDYDEFARELQVAVVDRAKDVYNNRDDWEPEDYDYWMGQP